MRRLAYYLCISTCLSVGLVIYANSFLSGSPVASVLHDKPPPLPLAKPKPATAAAATTTGSINPRANAHQLPKIPGVRFAAVGTQALPSSESKRWAPAVGYNSVVTPAKQAAPATVRKPRRARAGRYYYRRPTFGFVIGIGPRFYW